MSTVSIVLPTYNVGKYIDRCLISCINQTHKQIEIIIVDDCGSDDSIRIAENYAAKDSRIRVIRNSKNLGTYHARRVGVENTNSDYILFLDPDDELELDCIESLLKPMFSQSDIIFFGSKRLPLSKRWGNISQVPILSKMKDKNELINNIFGCKRLCYGTEGKVIKKSILVQSYIELNVPNSERLIYGEDVLLFTLILLKMKTAISVDKDLYIYHKNEESITVTNDKFNGIFKCTQLSLIISKIKYIKICSKLDRRIKKHIINRLELDKLNIILSIEEGRSRKIILYSKHIYLRKSIRPAIKIVLHMFSLGKIEL